MSEGMRFDGAHDGDAGKASRVGFAVASGFALVGVALVVAIPRPKTPPPPASVVTNAAIVRGDGKPAQPAEAGPATAAPSAADAGAPFTPAWRVASLKGDPAVELVEGTFGKRSFSLALQQAGASKADVRRLARALEDLRLHHVESPAAKDSFVLARDRKSAAVVAFEIASSPTDVWQVKAEEARAGDEPRLVGKRLELHVEHRTRGVSFAITADLPKAIAGAGLRDDTVSAIDDALDGHVDLAALKPGVRMRVVVDEELVEGVFSHDSVEAVELVPRTGSPLRVYGWHPDPKEGRRRASYAGFYDAKGQKPYRGAFRSPLPLARITSRFNPKRMHPVLHVVMPHNGIDFGATTGTPVYASAAGTVETAGNGGPCGNMVEIAHEKGLKTAYCHLSRFAPGLARGQHVEARQLVGYVGATGRVTGPHLHFAVKRGGNFIDPLALKLDGVRVLPPSDRDAFQKHRADLDVALEAIALPPPVPGADAHADEPDDEPGEGEGD